MTNNKDCFIISPTSITAAQVLFFISHDKQHRLFHCLTHLPNSCPSTVLYFTRQTTKTVSSSHPPPCSSFHKTNSKDCFSISPTSLFFISQDKHQRLFHHLTHLPDSCQPMALLLNQLFCRFKVLSKQNHIMKITDKHVKFEGNSLLL